MWVGGYTTCVHQAVVGGDGLPSVADVHPCTFASGVAGSFAGPGHARLLAPLLGGIDVVSLDHVANILVSRGLEAFDEPFVGVWVHDGARPGIGAGGRFHFGLAEFLPFGGPIDGGVDHVVPWRGQGGKAVDTEGVDKFREIRESGSGGGQPPSGVGSNAK